MPRRHAWLWDVNLDAEDFEAILSGEREDGPHDRRWALLRLIEYAPYGDIRRLLPLDFFLEEWQDLAPRVRSRTRREGMGFVHERHLRKTVSHD